MYLFPSKLLEKKTSLKLLVASHGYLNNNKIYNYIRKLLKILKGRVSGIFPSTYHHGSVQYACVLLLLLTFSNFQFQISTNMLKTAGGAAAPMANNFRIGHDSSVTKGTLQSVFKKDFPEHGAYGRADLAKPPRLGDVMHIDDHFNHRTSETSTCFEYKPMKKPVLLVSLIE